MLFQLLVHLFPVPPALFLVRALVWSGWEELGALGYTGAWEVLQQIQGNCQAHLCAFNRLLNRKQDVLICIVTIVNTQSQSSLWCRWTGTVRPRGWLLGSACCVPGWQGKGRRGFPRACWVARQRLCKDLSTGRKLRALPVHPSSCADR